MYVLPSMLNSPSHLPVSCLINRRTLVLHGGLFRKPGKYGYSSEVGTLDDLRASIKGGKEPDDHGALAGGRLAGGWIARSKGGGAFVCAIAGRHTGRWGSPLPPAVCRCTGVTYRPTPCRMRAFSSTA